MRSAGGRGALLVAIALGGALAAAAPASADELDPPELIGPVEAVYPPGAAALGIEATVELEILVDEEGRSAEVKVLRAAGGGFDEAAVEAARRFTWRPGRVGERAVRVRVIYEHVFRLPAAAPAAAPPDAAIGGETPAEDAAYTTLVQAEREPDEIQGRVLQADVAVRLPGVRGEALRAVESYPGVARPPLGVGALIVRGSRPQDSSTHFQGHWVPLLYHFGGITTIINSDLLERLDYVPGNFSPRYGRATGGVIDVEVRRPARDRLRGYVDADVIDAGFLLEGPVGEGSFALAARRSYIDAVFSSIVPDDAGLDFSRAPRYWDWQAIFDHPLGGGRLSILAFGADDRLDFAFGGPSDVDPLVRGSARLVTSIHRLQGTWRRAVGPRTDLLLSAGSGFGDIGFGVGPLYLDIGIWRHTYRAEVTHRPLSRLEVVVGTEGELFPYTVRARGSRPIGEGEVPTPPSVRELLETETSITDWHHGVYGEMRFRVGDVLLLPGARFDWFHAIGAYAVDPRLNARWRTGPGTVKAGLGRYSQPPQPWEIDDTFGNPALRPETSIHASLGYEHRFDEALSVEGTGFVKWLDDLAVVTLEPAVRPDGTVRPLGYANDGRGRVLGGELMLRHAPTTRFFGWIAYTLSRSERRDGPGRPVRLFTFDQTHILSVVGSWKLPWRLEAGGRVRYVTGIPQTPIIGSVFDADADVYIPIPGAPMSERMGAFFTLDARIERRFAAGGFDITVYLDVENATNRRNPEGYFYSFDYRDRAVVTGLPIIPSLGVRGAF